MYKVMVITNPRSAVGFGLAGVEVIAVNSAAEARRELAKAVNDDRAGIIAMDSDYFDQVGPALRAKTEKLYRPVSIPIPSKSDVEEAEGGHRYLGAFIKRAVGFDIQLKG